MRCKICGAKLANEKADICLNCYKEYQEEEDLKKDNNKNLIIKRKYKILYVFFKYIEVTLIFALATLGFVVAQNFVQMAFCILIYLVVMVAILAWSKYIAKNTKVVFYDKKVVYTVNTWLYKNEKVVKYTDLKNVSIYQTFRQKRFKFGDICVYAKGSIPGATLLNGFQLKDVENVRDVLDQISELLGPLEN